MKNYFKKIVILVSLVAVLVLPYMVSASPSLDNLKTVGEKGDAPYMPATEYSLSKIVGIIIQAFLGILGVLFLIYVIYAGYGWMTAQGDEEKVTKAKDTLTRAIIGLIITIGAYAISVWVFNKLLYATSILK